jgi:geranylgeranylglycerol-phosphate geranylgeranyltransferase
MVELIRPELPLSAGLCVLTGEVLALGTLPGLEAGILGFLVGFLISGAAMVSNDYHDLAVDWVNHPGRPLPSGRVSKNDVIGLTVALAIAGLIAAAFIGLAPLALAMLILAIGLLYNWRLKERGLLGNLMVSTSVGATFAFGGTAAGDLNGLVLIFAAMAFTFDLGEEIAADAMDVEGDKERSVRSLAIVRGRVPALRISAVLFALFIALTFIPYALGWLGVGYLIVIAAADIILAFLVIGLLRSTTKEQGRRLIRWMYLTATVTVLAFVIARLIVN